MNEIVSQILLTMLGEILNKIFQMGVLKGLGEILWLIIYPTINLTLTPPLLFQTTCKYSTLTYFLFTLVTHHKSIDCKQPLPSFSLTLQQ